MPLGYGCMRRCRNMPKPSSLRWLIGGMFQAILRIANQQLRPVPLAQLLTAIQLEEKMIIINQLVVLILELMIRDRWTFCQVQ